MNPFSFLSTSSTAFTFLHRDDEELRRLMPDAADVLPVPQRVFLEDEDATPLLGFPILTSERTQRIRQALDAYLDQEVRVQTGMFGAGAIETKFRDQAWGAYRDLLVQVTENTTRSSFGRRYTAIFWLYHSIAISRLFKEMPQKVRRFDLETGRQHGEAIKYQVFERFLDRVLALTYDTVHRVATETEEDQIGLFPGLLNKMRDNLLILTEDHISPDLSELSPYLRGYLDIDPNDFRRRVRGLHEWHRRVLRDDPDLRVFGSHLTRMSASDNPDDLLRRPGYVSLLADRRGYDREELLDAKGVQVWESLLVKLKEFELLLALRRLVMPVREHEGHLVCQAPNPRGGGFLSRSMRLSDSTRPFEFMTPWVVDPLVRRFGLIYDIAEFSAIVSMLKYSGRRDEDQSYRSIFRFQRRVNQMARHHLLKLEKYLGDGALYSGRHPRRLLATAIHLQRFYRQALRERFPFDRGIRMALNYGQYRLLPIEEGLTDQERRYEFFGHGIIELSRLVSGKSSHAIATVKRMLLSLGYSAQEVERFFRPLVERRLDLVDEVEQSRDFYAYISQTGALINEGIVATDRFVSRIDPEGDAAPYRLGVDGPRRYVVVTIDEGTGPLPVGLRRLGSANLKGIESTIIFELVDGAVWDVESLARLHGPNLNSALETVNRSEELLRQSKAQPALAPKEIS
ncbi:MAG: hypothetical protein OES32_12220 [Acidobacteriota bacterium]|nr:hypothetical protein [Acidobacteriota bacterium]MDH3524340.1 hypothetical protein [Acidobacteriota bacterium]